VLIKQEYGQYVVKLGEMGGEAMEGVVYKPSWFYARLPMVMHRVSQMHVVAELNPAHQGRNEKNLRTINGANAFGLFTDIFTHHDADADAIQIRGRLQLAGPHAQLVQAMLTNDPDAWTWEFRMRAEVDNRTYLTEMRHTRDRHGNPLMDRVAVIDDNGNPIQRRTLIPKVEKLITWDLHHKYN
jgi:hypothetical protein